MIIRPVINASGFLFQPHGGIPGSMRTGDFGDGDLARFEEMYSEKDYPTSQRFREQVSNEFIYPQLVTFANIPALITFFSEEMIDFVRPVHNPLAYNIFYIISISDLVSSKQSKLRTLNIYICDHTHAKDDSC